MFMKILSILTNILLSFLIVLSGSAFVVQNVTQTSSLQDAAMESGVYKGISEVVSKKLTDTLEKEAIMAGTTTTQDFSNIIDEAYVSAKGEELAKQIEDYKSGKTNSIVLDISDISERAKAQGVNIDSANLKPIEIVPARSEAQPKKISNSISSGQIVLYVLTALLFVASIVFGVLRRNLFGLCTALLVSSITLLSLAGVSSLIGTLVANKLSLPAEVSLLNPYVRKFTNTLLGTAGRLFLIQALGLLVISIIAGVVHRFIRKPTVEEPSQDIDPINPSEVDRETESKPTKSTDKAK